MVRKRKKCQRTPNHEGKLRMEIWGRVVGVQTGTSVTCSRVGERTHLEPSEGRVWLRESTLVEADCGRKPLENCKL